MADEYILKSFDGGAQKTTLTAPFTVGGSTLSVANGSTFPNGSSGPFVIVVDRGLAAEEKFLIDTTSGVNGVIFTIQQAGYDGTTASNHSSGASVEHCLDAYSIEQSNRYVNLQTTKGDLVTHNGTTTLRVGVGTNNQVLIADSVQAAGIKWGQVQSTGIADGSIVEAKIGDGQVTAAKIAAGAIPAGVPTGSITQYAGSAAPSGWLLCDGNVVSQTLYASLFAIVGTTYNTTGEGAGNFRLPNLKGRIPVGRDSLQAEFDVLGETGGSKTSTAPHTHSTSHSHTASSTGTTTVSGGQHSHSVGTRWVSVQDSVTGNNGVPSRDGTGEASFTGNATPSMTASTTVSTTVSAPNTTTSGDSSVTAVSGNLQPYLVVNYIIKT